MITSIKFFTREWWENYWYHYKWHTIAGIFVLILLVVTLKDCMTRIDYDLSVSYVGAGYIDEVKKDEMVSKMKDLIEDTTGDDEKNVLISNITLSKDQSQGQQTMAMQQKLMIEMAAGETFLYIYDDDLSPTFAQNEILMDEYTADFSGMKNTKIGVRVLRNNEFDKPKIKAQQDNAIKVFNQLKQK